MKLSTSWLFWGHDSGYSHVHGQKLCDTVQEGIGDASASFQEICRVIIGMLSASRPGVILISDELWDLSYTYLFALGSHCLALWCLSFKWPCISLQLSLVWHKLKMLQIIQVLWNRGCWWLGNLGHLGSFFHTWRGAFQVWQILCVNRLAGAGVWDGFDDLPGEGQGRILLTRIGFFESESCQKWRFNTYVHIYIYTHTTYIEHRNILEICIPKFPLLRASIHVQTWNSVVCDWMEVRLNDLGKQWLIPPWKLTYSHEKVMLGRWNFLLNISKN